jgi:pyruvate dehydrogenase kinase 2/3/4
MTISCNIQQCMTLASHTTSKSYRLRVAPYHSISTFDSRRYNVNSIRANTQQRRTYVAICKYTRLKYESKVISSTDIAKGATTVQSYIASPNLSTIAVSASTPSEVSNTDPTAVESSSTLSTAEQQLPLLSKTDDIDVLLQQSGIPRDYIEQLGKQNPTPLRLKDMYEYGCSGDQLQRLRNAQFLHRELPVRIGHRAIDLLTLPHGLSNAIPIRQVATIYLTFLRRLYEFPLPTNVEQEERFTDTVQAMILDRTSIPTSIAQGIQAWWQKAGDETTTTTQKTVAEQYLYEDRLREMDLALVRFFTARLGLRFLTEQFVLTSPRESAQLLSKHNGMLPLLIPKNTNDSQPQQRLGCIQPNVDVAQEVRRIADIVAQQTKDYYNGLCPEIHIVDCASDYDEFTFVPHHLQYMVSELLKNSCRASVRKYKEREAASIVGDSTVVSSKLTVPSIRVIIVKGSEDVTIKIADQGGGIPRSRMATIWRFAHSTANVDEQDTTFGVETSSGARLRGFGLPLAEIHARYFGGELTLKSTEGYGLDAYLHLPRLGDACENLPLRVRDSPAGGVSLPTTNDIERISVASRPRTMGTRSIRSSSRTYTDAIANSIPQSTTTTGPLGALDLVSRSRRPVRDDVDT